jgi:hypothetical protein
MNQFALSIHTILSLVLILSTTMGFGCSGDTLPLRDPQVTDETLCDGIDDDDDNRIDEGLLNACLGCADALASSCLNTTVTLSIGEPTAVTPAAFQYRIHKPERRLVMGHECIFERVQSYQPVVLIQALTLIQSGQPGAWSTDPMLVDDAFMGVYLDGQTPIELNGFNAGTPLRLRVTPPSPQSEAAQRVVKQCVELFDETIQSSDALELEDVYNIFIGGSTQLEADPAEIATSFFVLSGIGDAAPLTMSTLIEERPYLPDAVRCTISTSSVASTPIDHNGFQLSAQTSVASARSFDPLTRPMPIRSFQSIVFDRDSIRVNLSDLNQWGSPQSVELTRSGNVNGAYESQKLTCEVGVMPEPLEIKPQEVFPAWQGMAPPQEILRLNWVNVTTPFEAHPNLVMREALTIQRIRIRD